MNFDTVYNSPITSPGLAITAGGAAATYLLTAFKYKINGKLYAKAAVAAGVVPATFVVETGFIQGLTVYVNAAGVVSYEEGVTVDRTDFPEYNMSNFARNDKNLAIIGYIVVDNHSGAQFVGGTTNLDATNVTTNFISAFGIIGM